MSEVGFTKRVPLREVVAECVQRWFNATLKDAEHGDRVMQSLVGQMYCLGYGVPHDIEKVCDLYFKSHAFINHNVIAYFSSLLGGLFVSCLIRTTLTLSLFIMLESLKVTFCKTIISRDGFVFLFLCWKNC
ncbi:hypothetical protein O6H91_03G106600 [Diphasiastrum complanatum]|uniref:Uncharacterized protein n=1 Tax=Diphasiastrum complanatum TaxID=34168 RepID=A0ACC2EA66_DIPCM|nr:hypothetical protein O6H91_03G106600 [Diphasiastrum complanatum]